MKADSGVKGFDAAKVLKNLSVIVAKANIAKELVKLLGKIKSMIRLVKAWYEKRYSEVPKKTITMICFALGYVFAPADLIPDNIPGTGYIDDAFIVEQVIKAVNEDLEKFENWEKQKTIAA